MRTFTNLKWEGTKCWRKKKKCCTRSWLVSTRKWRFWQEKSWTTLATLTTIKWWRFIRPTTIRKAWKLSSIASWCQRLILPLEYHSRVRRSVFGTDTEIPQRLGSLQYWDHGSTFVHLSFLRRVRQLVLNVSKLLLKFQHHSRYLTGLRRWLEGPSIKTLSVKWGWVSSKAASNMLSLCLLRGDDMVTCACEVVSQYAKLQFLFVCRVYLFNTCVCLVIKCFWFC